jgi:predicted permease
MIRDAVFALRLFRRQLGLVVMTVAGLALAIGVSTAVFSYVNAVSLRGYWVPDAESVLRLSLAGELFDSKRAGGGPGLSGNWAFSDVDRLRRDSTTMEIVAIQAVYGALRDRRDDDSRRPAPHGMAVTGDFFRVMGATPRRGRLLSPADDQPGAALAVVLSEGYWKAGFDADRDIIGRTLWLDGEPVVVVGVTARPFTGPDPDGAGGAAYWVALQPYGDLRVRLQNARAATERARFERLSRTPRLDAAERESLKTLSAGLAAPARVLSPTVTVFGRLRPGVSREHAHAETTALATAYGAERGQNVSDGRPAIAVQSLAERRAGDGLSGETMAMLFGGVALVVLLAVANVANLLLAGAARRHREIGVRLALGAGRARVVRQLLTESLLLAGAGAAGGLAAAAWLVPAMAALWDVNPTLDVSLDGTSLAFTLALSLFVAIAAGLAPARAGARGDVHAALKNERGAAPRLRSRLRSTLVGVQAAVSIGMLVVAALLARSFVKAAAGDLGFDHRRLVAVQIGLGRGYDMPRIQQYLDAALDRIRQLPPVAAAAWGSGTPISTRGTQRLPDGRVVLREHVSVDYFEVMGIRFARGRRFTPAEVASRAPVAIVSESFARAYWPDQDPIGQMLDPIWGPPRARSSGSGFDTPAGTRIVGVVADTITSLDIWYAAPTIYIPLRPDDRNHTLLVRTHGEPEAAMGALRSALLSIDPEQSQGIRLTRDAWARQLRQPMRFSALAAVVAGTALGLAVIGLFGVTAFIVSQRRHEVSVRMSLGALPRQVVTLMFRDSLRPVVIGLAAGLLASLWFSRLLQSVLYGVDSRDPLAVVAATTVLIAATGLAAFLPARRAARANPAELLRDA